MANIGTFKKSGTEYLGEIVTLSVQTKNVRIVPEATRASDNAPIVTTNLPFSEWSQVIPNPRLCKALIDRLASTMKRRLNSRAFPVKIVSTTALRLS